MRRRPALFAICLGGVTLGAAVAALADAPETATPVAATTVVSPRVERELRVAGALGTGPFGLRGERGASLGVRQKVAKYLWLGGNARWFSSAQNGADQEAYVLHRGLALFEAAWTLELGQKVRLSWVECIGVASFVSADGGPADDWVAPAVMGMANAAWRLSPQWSVGLGGGWLVHWARVDGKRRRTSTRSAELNLGYAF
jgi:hypothetical protein